jgi:hypothetical protein
MTTLPERITAGMSDEQRADAARLDRAIATTSGYLESLRRQRRELQTGINDEVPVLTLDAGGFIPQHQIDQLVQDSSDTQIVTDEERAELLAFDACEELEPERWDGLS